MHGQASFPMIDVAPRVRQRLRSLSEEVAKLRQALDAAQARVAELEKIADTDVLLPVANRRGFHRHLARAVGFRDRHGIPSALLFVDLNGLKIINDVHGHAAGDAALRHVAETLVANVRASDAVGRLGGDEFGVLLFHADWQRAQAKAEQLSVAIQARPITVDGTTLSVSAAIGVYLLESGETLDVLLARANEAMYARKRREAA